MLAQNAIWNLIAEANGAISVKTDVAERIIIDNLAKTSSQYWRTNSRKLFGCFVDFTIRNFDAFKPREEWLSFSNLFVLIEEDIEEIVASRLSSLFRNFWKKSIEQKKGMITKINKDGDREMVQDIVNKRRILLDKFGLEEEFDKMIGEEERSTYLRVQPKTS